MLRVLFFGRFREELNCPELELAFAQSYRTLDQLQQHLIAEGGEPWSRVLEQDNVIRAVNQAVADGNPELKDGDEIAFFPPVTGG